MFLRLEPQPQRAVLVATDPSLSFVSGKAAIAHATYQGNWIGSISYEDASYGIVIDESIYRDDALPCTVPHTATVLTTPGGRVVCYIPWQREFTSRFKSGGLTYITGGLNSSHTRPPMTAAQLQALVAEVVDSYR